MRGKPPTFESFSKAYGEENIIFRDYLMTRAQATDGPSVTKFMILYCILQKGAALMNHMLKQEGLSQMEIDIIDSILHKSEEQILQDLKDLGMSN